MKVTLLSTYTSGGAGIACRRLAKALQKQNIEVSLLTQARVRSEGNVFSVTHSASDEWKNKVRLARELLPFILQEKSKQDRFKFAVAREGIDVSKHPVILNSDIIHLHWINQGFLSLGSIDKLKALNKPIVWTLHDMWMFTGGCHHSGRCRAYEQVCQFCPYLKRPSADDLSNKVWRKKYDVFKNLNVTVVTCSEWLKSAAEKSNLAGGFKIHCIPNPIDTGVFMPQDKRMVRAKLSLPDTKIILFGAMNLDDKNKGFEYLVKALGILSEKYPGTKNEIKIVTFGKTKNNTVALPFKTTNMGILHSDQDVRDLYSAADLFVLPSLEENLPNTIMESLACGTPVVGFRTGGVPEMIDHLDNGYVAQRQSAEDLAEGLYHILYRSDEKKLKEQCRKKVIENYSETIVANKYIEVYKSITA